MDIEKQVKLAVKGDKSALEKVCAEIRDNIYYLSLRMLADPEAAKDATQDILIKIITHLSSFRFDAKFSTWVYRVATNYLISEKKILDKDPGLSFEIYQQDLEQDLQPPAEYRDHPEYQTLLSQLRVSCTMAMLLCLKPTLRMAYILGDIFELDHLEASEVLDISKASYRKQLSRAREQVLAFTNSSCGLVTNQAKCSCEKKLTGAIKRQRIDPDNLIYTDKNQRQYIEVQKTLQQVQQDIRGLALQRSVKHVKSPEELNNLLAALVDQGMNKKAEAPLHS